MTTRSFLAVFLAVAVAVAAQGAELGTLATMAVQGALDPLIAEFQRATGHTIRIDYDTGPGLSRRLAANETADVIVAPTVVVEQGIRDGRVVGATRGSIGTVGVGIAARQGAFTPDVRSPEALRNALLAADFVYFSQGQSGAHVASVFASLGIADQIKARTRQLANGKVVVEQVIADQRNTLGFTMISEIRYFGPKGARLLGPLPGNTQNFTPYSAAVMTGARDAAAARGFVTFITSPAARARFRGEGWE